MTYRYGFSSLHNHLEFPKCGNISSLCLCEKVKLNKKLTPFSSKIIILSAQRTWKHFSWQELHYIYTWGTHRQDYKKKDTWKVMSIQITWHTHTTNLSLLSICSLRSIYTRDYSEYFLIHVNRYQSALQTLSDLSCLNCHKQLTQRPLSYSFENGKLKYKSPNSIVKYINAVLKCNANSGRGRKSLIGT